jgi:hypothetical protein
MATFDVSPRSGRIGRALLAGLASLVLMSTALADPDHIVQLVSRWGPAACVTGARTSPCRTIGLNQDLGVKVAPADGSLDAKKYVLFFNGLEVKGLSAPYYDPQKQTLFFTLQRNADNRNLWTSLLGSPRDHTVSITVSLGVRPTDPHASAVPTIFAPDANQELDFSVVELGWLVTGLAVVSAAVALVWIGGRKSAALRDNLLPQIAPTLQTYSLGRWQMAFWFTLIFASFVLLFLVLWDTGTVSSQALMLMGISGVTALAAVEVDVAKDSPADAVNRGLRALGLNSYADVLRVQHEIAERQEQLKTVPPPANTLQLQNEIQQRHVILQTYEVQITPFLTQGWFRDLTTDLNGTALHRLQVFCWTWVLGGIFVFSVWRTLSMPEFSGTLLALMGISSAGYVGFKIPEKNN